MFIQRVISLIYITKTNILQKEFEVHNKSQNLKNLSDPVNRIRKVYI